MILYISHGARLSDDPSDVNWFVVEPQNQPRLAIESLFNAGRRVICITDITGELTVKEIK